MKKLKKKLGNLFLALLIAFVLVFSAAPAYAGEMEAAVSHPSVRTVFVARHAKKCRKAKKLKKSKKKKTKYVYVTYHGRKYHYKSCPTIKRRDKKKVKLSWAKKHGYKACKVCH